MPRIDGPVLHRGLRPLFRFALCSQLLWPLLALADTPYDEMVRDARAGHYTPALTVLRQVPPGQASGHQSDGAETPPTGTQGIAILSSSTLL